MRVWDDVLYRLERWESVGEGELTEATCESLG